VRQNLSIDVAAFVQRYNPLLGVDPNLLNDPNIVSDTVTNGQRIVTVAASSGTRATTRGIELAADWRVTKAWRQQLAYSYMETQFATPMIVTSMGGTPVVALYLGAQRPLVALVGCALAHRAGCQPALAGGAGRDHFHRCPQPGAPVQATDQPPHFIASRKSGLRQSRSLVLNAPHHPPSTHDTPRHTPSPDTATRSAAPLA